MDDIPQPMEPASVLARNLFESEPVTWDQVEANDWISCGWSRPRLVQEVIGSGDNKLLYLSEPDDDRWNIGEYRVVSLNRWNDRDGWIRFPKMRILWVAAG